MASKFSRNTKAAAPPKPVRPTTEADVMRAMPEFISARARNAREARLNHGIPEERLLAKLKLTDHALTAVRLKELLEKIRQGGSIEFGLFPTSQGSEQGWRRKW